MDMKCEAGPVLTHTLLHLSRRYHQLDGLFQLALEIYSSVRLTLHIRVFVMTMCIPVYLRDRLIFSRFYGNTEMIVSEFLEDLENMSHMFLIVVSNEVVNSEVVTLPSSQYLSI